jgi:hypothetical protein
MAQAKLTPGQQKVKKQYTITCGESEAALIQTALYMLAGARDYFRPEYAVCASAEDARALYDRFGVPMIYSTGRHAPSCGPRADADNLKIDVDYVADGEPEPGKVTLEMAETQAEAVASILGKCAIGGDQYGVRDALMDAGVDGGRYEVSCHDGLRASPSIRITRK